MCKNLDRRGIWGFSTEGTYALLHENTELSLILDIDQLLRAIARVADVELHVGG